jgi:DNA-binding PadR family transcriptional regulator
MDLLPQVSFSILLALSLRPRHGYEIIKQVEEDSSGKIKLGAGTLYGAIKKLRQQKYIEEVFAPKADRRRYYQLTQNGQERLEAELEYFAQTIGIAKKRQADIVPIVAGVPGV